MESNILYECKIAFYTASNSVGFKATSKNAHWKTKHEVIQLWVILNYEAGKSGFAAWNETNSRFLA